MEKTSIFATLDTYGARDIGRVFAGLGVAAPSQFVTGDQLDFIALIAGPSATDDRELIAGGLAYRVPLGAGPIELFFNVDHAAFELGTAANLALEVEGERTQMAFGAKHVTELPEDAKLTWSLEMIAREEEATLLGNRVRNERLRILRAAVLWEKGKPFGFQRRVSSALTWGHDGFGATPADNLQASILGASSDFLRLSFGAETSLPLSRLWVVNAGIIAQFTDDSLPVSQRCGYGTNTYARGFDLSYVNGDRCLGARLEMAANLELPTPNADKLVFTQGYLGVDHGVVENVANDFLDATKDDWSSISVGIRTLRGNWIAEASVTHIVEDPGGFAAQSDQRLWLRAAVKF